MSAIDQVLTGYGWQNGDLEQARAELAQLRATIAQQAAQLEQAQTAIRTARQQLRATQENWREDCLYRADEILSKALGEEAQHAQAQQA